MGRLLGAEFGAVRVHTDDRADQLSRMLGARAFTTGNDIFFRRGAFAPEHASGRRLIAHELVHVLQQGAARRDAQVIQREQVSVPWGSARNPRSHVRFLGWVTLEDNAGARHGFHSFTGGARVATFTADPGFAGRIDLTMLAIWSIENLMFDEHGYNDYQGLLPLNIATDGRITFHTPVIIRQDQSGSGVAYNGIAVASSTTPTGGFATYRVLISHSASTGLAGGIGVGPYSVSTPVSTSIVTANALARHYVVNLRVRRPAPIAFDPPVRFLPDEHNLVQGEQDRLQRWYMRQPRALHDAIRAGHRAVCISGFASTTNTLGHNERLSRRRAERVQAILRGFAGSQALLLTDWYGEACAGTPDQVEAARERRVEVVIRPDQRCPAGR
jgi:outer membrane protein OmpA-like peptidoglycan-associated protein